MYLQRSSDGNPGPGHDPAHLPIERDLVLELLRLARHPAPHPPFLPARPAQLSSFFRLTQDDHLLVAARQHPLQQTERCTVEM